MAAGPPAGGEGPTAIPGRGCRSPVAIRKQPLPPPGLHAPRATATALQACWLSPLGEAVSTSRLGRGRLLLSPPHPHPESTSWPGTPSEWGGGPGRGSGSETRWPPDATPAGAVTAPSGPSRRSLARPAGGFLRVFPRDRPEAPPPRPQETTGGCSRWGDLLGVRGRSTQPCTPAPLSQVPWGSAGGGGLFSQGQR